ncbi:hypothetical protein B0H16DRAFT_157764 [Mycena metata]|uniref:Uncharacterized protein n=1 Tax=Mycena metata TaxID=1033252 RepID=A0AAD7MVK1_9AGAR|nr:hypothetical protein B0H16DRAFT_157764 [Mycena metata]
MDGRVWKHDSRRRPTLKPLVVAHNTATYPVEFALGTFHKTRSDQDFSPFLLIPDVLPGNFCIAPQCADLRVNAYIAQNIQNRQRLNKDLFGVSNADDFTVCAFYDNGSCRIMPLPCFQLSYGSTSAAQLPEEEESDTAPLLNDPTATAQFVEEDKEFDAAPEAYLEDEEVDGAPKIISPPLLGEKGTLVSSLDKTTCWRLVTELGALKLKIVSREEKV